MRIQDETTIHAPAATVWALTSDIDHWPKLMPTVTAVQRLDGGALAVGSRARVSQPRQRPRIWTVTEVLPESRFVWEAPLGRAKMTATHHISATDDGCRNILAIDITGAGSGLIGRFVHHRVAKTLATENACFKQSAESMCN